MTVEAPVTMRESPAAGESSPAAVRWRVARHVLFAIWVLAAAITMYPSIGEVLRLSGTLFTSYAADLAFPPWFYIVCRHHPPNPLTRWLGRAPVLLAAGILVVGALSEFVQLHQPRLISGTFDPLDIAAYAVGLALCLIFDTLPSPQQDLQRADSSSS